MTTVGDGYNRNVANCAGSASRTKTTRISNGSSRNGREKHGQLARDDPPTTTYHEYKGVAILPGSISRTTMTRVHCGSSRNGYGKHTMRSHHQ
ncbi:hypothetical protein NL676_026008 [Syzygium grande]|nr:hypothetical protein NL676_026008 [Syzygium grande]